ncbi:hypothetical protein AQUCO_05800032v1 [Aquilegia coerulea]|uniref:Reticulon-like protein n=1 Tax=Aquilegia coerulea TaxID=218851 RepID=A0A2G5CED2_AQUCA|nr:hypothetical protein AQUCO_05800032v1 [Aquilegia coerulea]
MAIDEGFGHENPKNDTCVVIGGRSFIGKPLVSMLLKSSKNWIVRIADSDPCINLDLNEKNSLLSESISSGRASYFQVDVRDKSQIIRAIEGSSVIFHMGVTTTATNSSSNNFYLQYMITVQGTKNVIRACRDCKVKRLIYNSTADVVFDGKHDINKGDESLPYPSRFEDMLSDLKAQAEALVLFANDGDGLLTCVLRPCNAFGPGDGKLVPLLLSAAKSGLFKFIVGNGENMCDFTYVDNVAHAHVCAEEALCSRTDYVAGKAFFITNLDSVKFWDFVSLILEGLGYSRPRYKIPVRLVWFRAVLSKWIHEILEQGNANPFLSLSIVHQLSCTLTFNCSQAQNHIGYAPIVSLEEGITSTIESFSHMVEDSPQLRFRDCNEPSKVDKILGRGRVADLLLWRDDKKTFAYFLGLVLFYCWFFLSARTFVSSAAKFLLMIAAFLFSNCILPASLFGFTIKKLSPSQFEMSETVEDAVMCLASGWNHCMQTLRLVAQGGDWNIFLKVVVLLYLFKSLVLLPFSAVIGVALVFAFTAFFMYKQHEDEVDRLIKLSSIGLKSLKRLLMRNLPENVGSFLSEYPDDGSS